MDIVSCIKIFVSHKYELITTEKFFRPLALNLYPR